MKHNWSLGWNAIAAIGQCASALLTIFVVYAAFFQIKPRVKVTAKFIKGLQGLTIDVTDSSIRFEKLVITVSNIGIIPVKIIQIGLRLSKKGDDQYYILSNFKPINLMPSEETSYNPKMGEVREIELKDKEIENITFAIIATGKIFYKSIGIIDRIKRWYLWHFKKIKIEKD